MVQRYLSLGTWLDRSVALADYYDVPLGHIDGDQPLLLSDICFSWRLIQQDIILWWSPSEHPDLGGVEDHNRPTEDVQHTESTSPGSYSDVCLEVIVRNLAVNSVLHSVAVNELEGSGGATAFDSVSRTLAEFSGGETQRDLTLGESKISNLTFGILKSMVKTWLLDKVQGKFESPAMLAIDHFWHWIGTSASYLHDPNIYRFVHRLYEENVHPEAG
jgi:DNA polymerase epsilon subunit 1